MYTTQSMYVEKKKKLHDCDQDDIYIYIVPEFPLYLRIPYHRAYTHASPNRFECLAELDLDNKLMSSSSQLLYFGNSLSYLSLLISSIQLLLLY